MNGVVAVLSKAEQGVKDEIKEPPTVFITAHRDTEVAVGGIVESC